MLGTHPRCNRELSRNYGGTSSAHLHGGSSVGGRLAVLSWSIRRSLPDALLSDGLGDVSSTGFSEGERPHAYGGQILFYDLSLTQSSMVVCCCHLMPSPPGRVPSRPV